MLGKNKSIILGVCGGSGSGKSTFVAKLKEAFNDDISVLCHDNYYKARDEMSIDERDKINHDHPDEFETSLLLEHLNSLKAGASVLCPIYDYSIHNRTKDFIEIKPNKIIVVEGILIFENKQLRDLFDIKVFLDVDSDERILRRVLRDINSRDRSLESIATRYLSSTKPMHYKYVEPSKKFADIIINDSLNAFVLDAIVSVIKARLESKKDA